MKTLEVRQHDKRFSDNFLSQGVYLKTVGKNIEIGYSSAEDNKIHISMWDEHYNMTSLFFQIDENYKVRISAY